MYIYIIKLIYAVSVWISIHAVDAWRDNTAVYKAMRGTVKPLI